MKVLFMSGYTENMTVVGNAFLQKPLTPDGLSRAVRQTLDSL
jgi:hypothetical protein